LNIVSNIKKNTAALATTPGNCFKDAKGENIYYTTLQCGKCDKRRIGKSRKPFELVQMHRIHLIKMAF